MAITMSAPLVLVDPGYLLWAPAPSTLPTMVAASSTYTADAWPAAWIPLGATEDGSEFSYETRVEAVRVAEIFNPIRYSITEMNASIAFNVTNITLNMIKRMFNGGTIATVSGTGATLSSKYTPPNQSQVARCMIGWESLAGDVRLIGHQTINGGTIKMAFKRAPALAVIPAVFNFEVPSGQDNSFDIWGAGTGRLGT